MVKMRAPADPCWCSSSQMEGNQSCQRTLRGHAALLLREEVQVAVVVVAGVGVVELGQRAWLRRACRATLLYQSVTMIWPSGLSGRDQQEDDVVEDLADGGRVVGGELVDELDDHLRGADLGGVDAGGDQDDGLAIAEDFVALGVGGGAALEVELALEGFEAVELLEVVGRADLQQDVGIAVGGGSEIAEADAVGVGGDLLQVVDDFVPAGEFAVGADAEAEVLVGGLDGGVERGAEEEGQRESLH